MNLNSEKGVDPESMINFQIYRRKNALTILDYLPTKLSSDETACSNHLNQINSPAPIVSSKFLVFRVPKESGKKSGRKKIVNYPCPVCKEVFSKFCNLKIHYSNLHDKILNLSCEYCNKEFHNPSNLFNHIIKHSGADERYECNYCSKKFHRKFHLERHKVLSHDKNLCRFMCNICEFRTATSRDLMYHKRIHLVKSFMCVECQLTFHSKSDLEKHSKVHSQITDFACEICFRYFSRAENLKRHVLTVHSSAKFKCRFCGAHFASKTSFGKHCARQHIRKKSDSTLKDSSDVLSLYK